KNGGEALAVVSEGHPDLILLDIEMPGMKGYDVCSILKADEKTKGIPVIFLSGMDEVFDKLQAFEVGGVDYVTKPFAVEEMLVRLETHLSLRKLHIELEEKNARLEEEINRRKVVERQLKLIAISDPLTKVYNRRFFFEMADREIKRAMRMFNPLSIVILDIDHFKKVNDEKGHLTGDQVLFNLARFFKQNLRSTDVFARYGGEEFVILMPDTDIQAAYAAVEKFRIKVAESPIVEGDPNLRVSLSMGIASASSISELDITRLLAMADRALYQAKENGRNQVVVWGEQ
ncbi:MAG: diguanylate cyclase, partial [Anaerolineae bacterium]|nr:diguanylate cyclase [Anaerolineae bacterium]